MSDDSEEVPPFLIARAASAAKMPGAELVPCDVCGDVVVLEPSGQRTKAANPQILILCWACLAFGMPERSE